MATLSLNCCRHAAAEVDGLRLRALENYPTYHAWDNVPRTSIWTRNGQPQFSTSSGLHTVCLAPGQEIEFCVPPAAVVRVLGMCTPLTPDQVEVWVANGSGLYCKRISAMSTDGKSLIVTPDNHRTWLARVRRPHYFGDGIEIAVFTSRLELPPDVVPYQEHSVSCAEGVAICASDEQRPQHYVRLEAEQPWTIPVEGPIRLAIETRYRYAATESRSFQSYRLRVGLDGSLYRLLEYETGAETNHLSVAGLAQPLGRRQVGYLEIPSGPHQLQLDATADVYLRLMSYRRQHYFVPQLNQPPWLSAASRKPPLFDAKATSSWQLTSYDTKLLPHSGGKLIASQEQLALRSARDNRFREGGLRSMMLMRNVAARRPDDPTLRRIAEQIRGFHTFFRNLPPVRQQPGSEQHFAWFNAESLPRRVDPVAAPVIAEQHIDDLVDRLSYAFFTTPGNDAASANVYRIPEELGSTFVRIAVDRRQLTEPAELRVQYDRRAPIELEVRHPDHALESGTASRALAALRWQHGAYDHGTLGGPFSRQRLPGPLIPVAAIELLVPSDVREIKIWTSLAGGAGVGVAVQYRASKPFRLSESEFLATRRRAGLDAGEFFRAILHGETLDGDWFANRELENHWLALVQRLHSHRRRFEAQVVRPEPDGYFVLASSHKRIRVMADKARRFVAAEDWLAGLEAWSEVLPHAPAELRHEGLFARITALQQLGEAFLADRTLRGLYLFDNESRVRATAFAQLHASYKRSGDSDSLEQLLAAAVASENKLESLNELTSILLENGENQLALMATLATPAAVRSSECVLRATFRLQWWELFQEELKHVPETRRRFWTAMRKLCDGDYEQALAEFREAGTDGRAYARHLELGQKIHALLQSELIDERVRALCAWEQWQASHPGPWGWHEAGNFVKSHAGAESLRSIERDRYAQFYRARRSRPLILQVQGPQKLRLECRPIHATAAPSTRDDWIHVSTAEGHRVFAVNGNRPSTGLKIAGDPHHVPGRKVMAHLELGPGLHEVRIHADELLLVRVFAQRPELPIGVLPPLTPDTLKLAIQQGFRTTSRSSVRETMFRLLTTRPGSAPKLAFVHQAWPENRHRHVPDNPVLAARLALRTGESIASRADSLLQWVILGEGSLAERALALARLEVAPEAWGEYGVRFGDLPPDSRDAFLMANQRYAALIALPLVDEASIRRRMTQLVWLAETEAGWQQECEVRSQRLFHDHPLTDGLPALHDRLTRQGGWSRVPQASASAGVRKLEWPHWVPESPSLRVRKSLIAPLQPAERLLFGHEALVLSMRNLQPAQFEVSLSAAAVGNLPMQPMRVACQQGELPPQWISVSRDGASECLQLEVPTGSHHVRLWIEEPIANHYVCMGIREIRGSDVSASATDLHATKRIYDVATHAEPLILEVEGPVWLRIDEWRGDMTHTRYLEILEPRRQIALKPRDGDVEALLRVFQYSQRPGKQVSATAWVQDAPAPLPAPLIAEPLWGPGAGVPLVAPADDSQVLGAEWITTLGLMSPDSPVMAVDVYDPYPLGDQTDGTWSIALGAFSRRPLEEGLDGRRPEQFLEARATYYQGDVGAGSFRRNDFLVRPWDGSGPTLGLLHRAWFPSQRWPLDYEWMVSGYAQQPGGAIVRESGNIEWSGTLRGRVLHRRQVSEDVHHTLRLSVFGRVLSQDRQEYLPGRIDQDVFTTYKANHLTGMTLSDTWVHQPRLDARWWVRPSLVTNEDYNLLRPDQLNLRCSWEQALGQAEVAASYRLTRFLSDRNRPRGRWQNLLYADLVTDLPFRRCAELLVRVQYDLDRGDATAQVSMAYFFDARNLERDRWPGERGFPSLRKQREIARGRPRDYY